MAVIIDGDRGRGNVNGNKFPKSGGREAFVGSGDRRDGRCVSGSATVGRYFKWRRGPCQRSGATWYYSFLFPTGPGGRRTPEVAEVAEVE